MKTPIKGLKIIDAGCSSYKPYVTIIVSAKEIFYLEIKRNGVPAGCVLNSKTIENK
jgi:hypothetical protein